MHYPTVIIGGGISGITAAVELAEAGREVVLVEKHPYLGGHVTRFSNYFPKMCPPACGLEINYRRIRSSRRIRCITGAEVTGISGDAGEFRLKLSVGAKMITSRCTACGKCAGVCPTDPKAAFLEAGLSFPLTYAIDPESCLGESCGKCLDVCDYNAIRLDAEATEAEIMANAVIVASGWKSFNAAGIANYSYPQDPDVVNNMEFEKILAACGESSTKLTRPSDGRVPGRIAFVQCAGSRDVNHLPYCSAVCCAASVKHALTLSEVYPDMRFDIFYIDLRLNGRNEKILDRARMSDRIGFIKGKVGQIERSGTELVIGAEDILAGTKRADRVDMVVLATGMVPNLDLPGLEKNEFGFFAETQQPGIYPAGSCRRPMDVSTSVKDATAAALKAMKGDHE